MKVEKLKITQKQFDVNLKFYFFLKYLLKATLSDRNIKKILEVYTLSRGLNFRDALYNILDDLCGKSKQGVKKKSLLLDILDVFELDVDSELFIFSLKLYAIKPL
ncbi:MAG: hypothetical protein IE880_07370, partial [Epsilonproteobacteria bacterium]|nr:hypothetical protein [Campylobacterota bacterium]